MIGLGSNRMSVCRRGGMRVTQAGKGGMEWLAGGRGPSWASPYSAQATAALKAQFPTQWATIRDYGFAHPALVPFINEDPMLVMSLIEGLGTRWLVGDGASYILTDYYPTSNFKAVAKIKTLDTLPIYFVFAAANTYNERNGYLLARSGQYESWYWTIGGAFINNNQYHINTNTVYNIEMIRTRVTINGTNFSVSGQTFTPTYKLAIMALSGGEYMAHNLGYSEHKNYEGDQLVIHLVPFVSTTRNGMLDIHDLEHPVFYPNAGTGTFTTIEQIAS